MELKEGLVSFFILLAAGVLSGYLTNLSLLYTSWVLVVTVIVIILYFLYNRLGKIDNRLGEIDDYLTGIEERERLVESLGARIISNLLPFVKKKGSDEPVIMGEIYDVFMEPMEAFLRGTEKGIPEIIRKTSPDRHERILELRQKVDQDRISLEEAEELRDLLREEREERRKAGDVLGAIAVGLFLLAILYLIARLLRER
ncbi:hypothetical protein AKJ43_02255 [candidate division MSBL1 archaeon SCGC-AAA261D19]|uniref:Uncharacterized protein n=1 Tax=candidate division MSBL1 archaeon SCGC-AAA261D19 TaxID=1698273 RepID=A0A133V709_9EURY|nr:hypothetical protein AKJ43_02255 [candidate division MSBL1 archaeon SCGC-AAA261D19]